MEVSRKDRYIITSRPMFPPDGDRIAARFDAIDWVSEDRKSYFQFAEEVSDETLEAFKAVLAEWGIE